jgi:hypothetical protein
LHPKREPALVKRLPFSDGARSLWVLCRHHSLSTKKSFKVMRAISKHLLSDQYTLEMVADRIFGCRANPAMKMHG